MTDEKLLELQKATITEHMARENRQDIPGTMATFGDRPDVFFDAVALNTVFTGREGVNAWYAALYSSFPDAEFDVKSETHVPGVSVLETEPNGTFTGADFAGIKATGKRFRIRLAAFFIFDKRTGELIGERCYWDQGDFVRQLGQP
jgi:steroid delta-isomerase-like uncharacterized protein